MAGSLTPEDRQGGSNSVERAAQVDIDHGIPILDAQRIEARNRPDPGVVHQDVQLAAALDRQCDKGFEVGTMPDVSDLERRLASRCENLIRNPYQDILAPGSQHDQGAVRCRAASPLRARCRCWPR